MNAQERDQLLKFLASLRQNATPTKDAVAQQIIQDSIGQQPDALYLLVQRSLALQLALDAALNKIKANESDPSLVQEKSDQGHWKAGLLAQVAAATLGSTVGAVAGGLLLQNLFFDETDTGDSFFD
jgi:hypothetical protein